MADIWLPDGPVYLDHGNAPPVRVSRPVFQGDVFVDVPMAMFTRFKDNQPDEAELAAKKTTVMTITHPCSMRRRDGRLKDVQGVARVIPMAKALRDAEWSHPWDGYHALFPLEGLSGEDHVADLSQIGITHAGYLEEQRVACLNLDGWVGLLWRITHYQARFKLPLEETRDVNQGHWNELEIWEKWVERTGSEHGYQEWLSEPATPDANETRREVLAGDPGVIEEALPDS